MDDSRSAILTPESTAPTRLSDVIYDGIVTLIAQGDLELNSRLPSESELSERFGVSRPVVREALGRLREDGVIVSRQGSGSYVQRQPDIAVLQLKQVSSLGDVQRCFEFRAGLEAAAAGLAAEKWQPEDLKKIEDSLHALEACVGRGDLGINEDRSFHEAIASATRNQYYISVQRSLAPHIAAGMNITRHLSLMRTRERSNAVQDEHVAIVEAIRRRDPEQASKAMQQHILNARQRMFEGV
ncbi:FadR/GntR family transcriptional regulator [Pelagibacterium limicola]|uniref:FadR/GntR family transcriptional regulator n=1 Tax=Pelagibacterium limicola TaxID=2791022 RepID=UPI003CCE2D68